jgi:hypothetical protein
MSPLVLSSQGSFLNAKAAWDPPLQCGDLQAWTHSASHGRDHFVEVVHKYFCYPDGMPITLVKQSARHFEAGDAGDGAGAYLRIRLITRPTKTSRITQLSEMPFMEEEVIPEQELLPIDLDPVSGQGCELLPCHDGWIDQDDMKELAFWPLVRGKKMKLKVRCTDHAAAQHEVQRAFILVSAKLLEKDGRLSAARQAKIDAAWEAERVAQDRIAELLGRKVAVAEPGTPNDTTIAAYSADFARAAFEVLPPSTAAERPFSPRLHRLTVSSESLSAIRGNDRPLTVSYRKFPNLSQSEARQFPVSDLVKGILTPDIAAVPGQPYLAIEVPENSGIGDEHAKRFAGLVQPNIEIAALGRDTELIPGDVQKYLSQTILPTNLFASAKLLGGIDLGSILSGIPKQVPTWVFQRGEGDPWANIELPNVVSNTSPPSEQEPDITDWPMGWSATYDWSCSEFQPFFLFNPGSNTLLSVHCAIMFNAATGTGTWQAKGTLRDFEIAIPAFDDPWIAVGFDEVTVAAESGQAPQFAPRIKSGDDAIRLGQKLEFLRALQKLLHPDDGISIDVTGAYVAVRQTTQLDDQAFGALAIFGLSFTFGIRLPFTGEPLEADFALGRMSDPFGVSIGGYSGAGFFETVVNAAGPKSLAVSLEFGGDYEASFSGVASGRAFLRAGFFFRKDIQNCTFRGFVRTGGHLSVLGIGGVSILALIGVTCTGSQVTGSAHVEITISIGWISVTRAFDISQQYAAPGRSIAMMSTMPLAASNDPAPQKSMTQRMSLEQWREYWNAFS